MNDLPIIPKFDLYLVFILFMSSNNIPILGTEEPPTKKMKKSKSVTRERKKSETEKIVEVSLTSLKKHFHNYHLFVEL